MGVVVLREWYSKNSCESTERIEEAYTLFLIHDDNIMGATSRNTKWTSKVSRDFSVEDGLLISEMSTVLVYDFVFDDVFRG